MCADSMVLAKLLVKLRDKHNNFRVVAVHIDYANRPESGAEADYVEAWCGACMTNPHTHTVNNATDYVHLATTTFFPR